MESEKTASEGSQIDAGTESPAMETPVSRASVAKGLALAGGMGAIGLAVGGPIAMGVMGARLGSKIDPSGGFVGAVGGLVAGGAGLAIGAAWTMAMGWTIPAIGAIFGAVALLGEKKEAIAELGESEKPVAFLAKSAVESLAGMAKRVAGNRLLRAAGMGEDEPSPEAESKGSGPGMR